MLAKRSPIQVLTARRPARLWWSPEPCTGRAAISIGEKKYYFTYILSWLSSPVITNWTIILYMYIKLSHFRPKRIYHPCASLCFIHHCRHSTYDDHNYTKKISWYTVVLRVIRRTVGTRANQPHEWELVIFIASQIEWNFNFFFTSRLFCFSIGLNFISYRELFTTLIHREPRVE